VTADLVVAWHSPTVASANTTSAFTSSSHLMRNPPLSFSHSLKMPWMSRVLSLQTAPRQFISSICRKANILFGEVREVQDSGDSC